MNIHIFTSFVVLFFLLQFSLAQSWTNPGPKPQWKRAIVSNDHTNDQLSFSSNDISTDESFSQLTQLQGELPYNRELSIFLFKSETKRLVPILRFPCINMYNVTERPNFECVKS